MFSGVVALRLLIYFFHFIEVAIVRLIVFGSSVAASFTSPYMNLTKTLTFVLRTNIIAVNYLPFFFLSFLAFLAAFAALAWRFCSLCCFSYSAF